MSRFFPEPKNIKVNSDVELIAFQCQDTVVQLASIAPGATFELHRHPESQIGMIFSGSLEMNINGTKELLEPLQQVYVAPANVLHGSINPSLETVLGFDVKRITNFAEDDEPILQVSPTEDKKTGLSWQSAAGSWFEVAIAKIPPGGQIPIERCDREHMGIILNGQLTMTVGEQQQQLEYGEIYYAPGNVVYGGHNSSTVTVSLIEILILPRSHSAS